MADFGIKVSSGNNILTAQEVNIIFSSNRNLVKTKQTGIAVSTAFSHGLSYAPIFFTNGGGIVGADQTTTCDSNNFYPVNGLRYYLFFQQAN